MARRVAFRTCPFCEATCGLELHLEARDGGSPAGREEIALVRGDRDDVFSHGFLCPKGTAIKQLEVDPDRLRRPLVRTGRGTSATWREVEWEEAFARIQERLPPIVDAHGRDAVGLYVGNPSAHNLASLVHGRVLTQALGSANVFTASTVDQMPKQVSAGLMFGAALSIPIPDLDRTDYLLILGANPYASNGSLCTAPDFPGRLDALRARGGRLVVVDPRRTKTAEVADEHVFLRPGTDALLLLAIVHTLFDEGLVDLGRLGPHTNGVETVREVAGAFGPDVVASRCGVDPETVRRLARELAGAERAAVYGRVGTCTQEFGTLASWLVDVVNVLTGNLDREGGAMFTLPAAGSATSDRRPAGPGRGVRFGRRTSRVRGAAEVFGEFPVACLAEEIETPGEGQIRALVTAAGNPVLSTPDGARLDRAARHSSSW